MSLTLAETFTFHGQKLSIMVVNDEFYFIGKQLTDILGYQNCHEALRDNVDDEWKIKYSALTEKYPEIKTSDQIYDYKFRADTTIVMESGMYSLTLGSKLPAAKEFRKIVLEEILPSIRKKGYYSMAQNEQTGLVPQLKSENPQDIMTPHIQGMILSFKMSTDLLLYALKLVIYIMYIGFYDGVHYFKFGRSCKFEERMEGHENEYEQTDYIFIIECRNPVIVEGKLIDYLDDEGIHTSRNIKGKNRKELFTISNIKHLSTIIDKLKYIVIADKESVNASILNELEHKLEISRSETREARLETREARLETENAKLRLEILKKDITSSDLKITEKDNKISELETELEEKDVKISELEVDTEEEKDTKIAELEADIEEKNSTIIKLENNIIEKTNKILTLEATGGKQCTGVRGCKQFKSFLSFSRDKTTGSGYYSLCKECHNHYIDIYKK